MTDNQINKALTAVTIASTVFAVILLTIIIAI